MAKVRLTTYPDCIPNVYVYPECPFAGKRKYEASGEVDCEYGDIPMYCSSRDEQNVCPFDKLQKDKHD